MKRMIAIATLVALLPACAPARPMVVRSQPPALEQADTPIIPLPVLAQTTTIERDYAVSHGAPQSPDQGKNKELGKLYYAGLGLGAIAGLLAAGFTTASFINDRNLEHGYADGMTEARHDQLSRRGKLNNTMAWTSLTLSVIGFAAAATILGESYRRCDSLAKKRLKCVDQAKSESTTP